MAFSTDPRMQELMDGLARSTLGHLPRRLTLAVAEEVLSREEAGEGSTVEARMQMLLDALAQSSYGQFRRQTVSRSGSLGADGDVLDDDMQDLLDQVEGIEIVTEPRSPPPQTIATSTAAAVEAGGGGSDTKESLDDLMEIYLGAVKRVRQLDAAQEANNNNTSAMSIQTNTKTTTSSVEDIPIVVTAPESTSLEGKLTQLMKALEGNPEGDVWPDKPAQTPLVWEDLKKEAQELLQAQGGDEDGEVEVEVVTAKQLRAAAPEASAGEGQSESLEGLVSTAMRLLRQEQQNKQQLGGEGETLTALPSGPVDDGRSMDELLAALDEIS